MAQGLQKGLPIIHNMYKIIITKRIGKRSADGSKEFYGIPKFFLASCLIFEYLLVPLELHLLKKRHNVISAQYKTYILNGIPEISLLGRII